MRKDHNLKAWAEEERKLFEDRDNLSDVAWRRMELLHATDYPREEEIIDNTNNIDWGVPADCPF